MQIIKGAPVYKWAEVQAIQHEPFVYIQHNGSHFAGAEPDDVTVLLEMLKAHALDARHAPFCEINPCDGVTNPNWEYGSDAPQFIDGERLYSADGVRRYSGNFLSYSHAFSLDTNDAETIAALDAAIVDNITNQG